MLGKIRVAQVPSWICSDAAGGKRAEDSRRDTPVVLSTHVKDQKSDVEGKSVDSGGRRLIKKKNKTTHKPTQQTRIMIERTPVKIKTKKAK